jgi:hypothetical protein
MARITSLRSGCVVRRLFQRCISNTEVNQRRTTEQKRTGKGAVEACLRAVRRSMAYENSRKIRVSKTGEKSRTETRSTGIALATGPSHLLPILNTQSHYLLSLRPLSCRLFVINLFSIPLTDKMNNLLRFEHSTMTDGRTAVTDSPPPTSGKNCGEPLILRTASVPMETASTRHSTPNDHHAMS